MCGLCVGYVRVMSPSHHNNPHSSLAYHTTIPTLPSLLTTGHKTPTNYHRVVPAKAPPQPSYPAQCSYNNTEIHTTIHGHGGVRVGVRYYTVSIINIYIGVQCDQWYLDWGDSTLEHVLKDQVNMPVYRYGVSGTGMGPQVSLIGGKSGKVVKTPVRALHLQPRSRADQRRDTWQCLG